MRTLKGRGRLGGVAGFRGAAGRAARVAVWAVAMVALGALVAGGVMAKPSGPGPGNSPNAKACQKGGWENMVDEDGDAFTSEEECVSYAAQGGELQPKPTEDPQLTRCKQELADAGLTEPANANYILGTEGNDDFTARMTAGNDVVCGFGGDDFIGLGNVEGDNIFLGGDGNDRVSRMSGGTFNGGAGNDNAGYGESAIGLSGGTFNGGAGNDRVGAMSGGTFNGGAGDDGVHHMLGGTFNGGDGDDRVESLFVGTFNGEGGCDSVGEGSFNAGDQSTCTS